jgi:hypothetical protein
MRSSFVCLCSSCLCKVRHRTHNHWAHRPFYRTAYRWIELPSIAYQKNSIEYNTLCNLEESASARAKHG